LPYFEQGSLFNAVNFSGPYNAASNLTVIDSGIGLFWCLSDPYVTSNRIGGLAQRSANDMVNWGNATYYQGTYNNPYTTRPNGTVAFACAPNGTTTPGEDHRGMIFNDDMNCSMFIAHTTPHSKLSDLVPGNCQYPFQNNPPCTTAFANGSAVPVGTPAYNAARSYHSGGVNTLFGDGSVKFAKDSVNPPVWQALSTTQGDEVISADSY